MYIQLLIFSCPDCFLLSRAIMFQPPCLHLGQHCSRDKGSRCACSLHRIDTSLCVVPELRSVCAICLCFYYYPAPGFDNSEFMRLLQNLVMLPSLALLYVLDTFAPVSRPNTSFYT
ncbi:unnamed protein product [Protopolystoma xenopodis]|uniref:Uncharacterized protein n=1 Tax=Protopolystoma xenopodis TaxID=117903 RepID=A0A448WLX3_9PLAT|nr:unnamed protein product [Protopolystoma xenopodis]